MTRRRAVGDPSYARRRAMVGVTFGAILVAVSLVLAASRDRGEATGTGTAFAPTTAAPTTTTTLPGIDAVGSDWWVVNPSRPMASDYVPVDLVTPNVPLKPDTGATQLTAPVAAAFEAMVADAAVHGHQLRLNSGYRSFTQQQMLYERFVQDVGQDAARQRVARPGTSEHQTGLSADVGLVGLADDRVFGDTEASVWVAANAHRFGFVVRYPPDKAYITGYTNEPWHLRYVGPELAAKLHASGLTMEEHFGLATTTTAPA